MSERRDEAMTRSEEELRVRTEWYPAERVVLRRRVVEEEVSVPVRVRREELVVEREALAGSSEPADAGGDDQRELVILLREERPVVGLEVVPRERVRVRRERVELGEQTVSGEVRRERIEVEQAASEPRSR